MLDWNEAQKRRQVQRRMMDRLKAGIEDAGKEPPSDEALESMTEWIFDEAIGVELREEESQ